MSYILDALKKADRERNLTKVPTLTTVHIPVYLTGSRLMLWIVGAVLLGGGALTWLILSSPKGPSVAPAPVGAPRTVAVAPPPSTADPESASPPREVIGPPPPASRQTALPRPSTGPRPEGRRQFGGEPPASPRASRAAPPESPPPVSKQPEPSATTLVPPESPAPSPRLDSLPREEVVQPRKDAVVAAPAPPPQSVPTLRDALAKMRLDVFVYTDVEAERMAVINGQRYVKGELVDGFYLVESINPEGVVLSYKGERLVLRP